MHMPVGFFRMFSVCFVRPGVGVNTYFHFFATHVHMLGTRVVDELALFVCSL